MKRLAQTILGRKFNSPIILASGTAGYGKEIAEFYSLNSIGGISLKALSVKKREGNPPPRIYETNMGIMNAIGLANEGLDYFDFSIVSTLNSLKTNIIVNVACESVYEFVEVIERLEKHETIYAFELNVSCPNVKSGGRVFGEDKEVLKDLVSKVRKVSKKTIIVKLPPMIFGIEDYAKIAVESGADMLSLINTVPALEINIKKEECALGNNFGGLSGKAVLPIALRLVNLVSKSVNVPIIGGGGIFNGEDAFKFILAGASLISVGTANMINPLAGKEITEELDEILDEKSYENVSDAISKLKFHGM